MAADGESCGVVGIAMLHGTMEVMEDMEDMEDSIFAKIIKGEIPCHKVYEDERTFAFLDIYPVQPGHTLVVPKRQIEFIWDLPAEDYRAVMETARKLAWHMRETLAVPFVGAKIVGVDVPHAHIHLVPFREANEIKHDPDTTAEPDHTALAAIASQLAF